MYIIVTWFDKSSLTATNTHMHFMKLVIYSESAI